MDEVVAAAAVRRQLALIGKKWSRLAEECVGCNLTTPSVKQCLCLEHRKNHGRRI